MPVAVGYAGIAGVPELVEKGGSWGALVPVGTSRLSGRVGEPVGCPVPMDNLAGCEPPTLLDVLLAGIEGGVLVDAAEVVDTG